MLEVQEQDRYRAFFEASADAMLIIDNDRFVDCNQSAVEMLGFDTKEELISTHPGDISPPTQPDGRSSFEKANEVIERALAGESCRFEWIHLRKNGEEFPVEVVLTSVPYKGKTVLNVTWRDITERKQLETELIAHRNNLQRQLYEDEKKIKDAVLETRLLGEAVSQSGTSIIITDRHGKIEYANPAFLETNGYSEEEVYGKTPGILNSGRQSTEFYREMWNTIKSGKIWYGTLQNKRKNGKLYWARLKIAPVINDDNEIHHYIGIEADITDFIEAKERAEKANKAKSDFLSSMSHEFRTPLNAIIGFAQLLEMSKKESLSENQKTHIFHIRNAGDHLLSLVNEILDLSKVETGKLSFNIENVNIRDVIDYCVDLSEGSYNRLNVRIEDRISGQLPILKVDAMRTKQVILNLISNAKKYNVQDGLVYLDCEIRRNGMFRIKITDTGLGIPEDKQGELFKPFNRLDAENSEIEGSGIGLVLTKKIVKGMKGTIGFSSTFGQGSTFWVDLPIHDMQGGERNTHHTDKIELTLDRKATLLYVDDTAVNRLLMKELVESVPNINLICAETASKALELAKTVKPHTIMMDIHLPDMSGYEAFKRLMNNEETRHIPVIAFSADIMPETIDRALELGFSEYLAKPFKIPDLLKVLNAVIQH